MKFVLDSKPFSSKSECKTAKNIMTFLDNLEDGILISSNTLSKRINYRSATIFGIIQSLEGYTIKYKNRRIYGNKKTIEEFIKTYGR